MLARTQTTEVWLRTQQAATEGRMRIQQAAAASNVPQELNRQRLRALIDRTVVLLASGTPTFFAYEGACRHGVRSSLCLQGWNWRDADSTAAKVVKAALDQLGTPRPSWREGQLDYAGGETTAERFTCVGCGGPTIIGLNGRRRKFCSDECLSRHHCRIRQKFGFEQSRAEFLASCAAKRKRRAAGERDCERCGKRFLQGTYRNHTYCSDACANAVRAEASRRHHDRACLRCGSVFKPGSANAKYCSRPCMAASFSETTRRPAKACQQCNASFFPSYRDEKYCSKGCRYSAAVKRPERACAYCRAMFRPRFTTKRGEAETCSYECTIALRRKDLPVLECAGCQSIFRRRGLSDKRKYCSQSCSAQAARAARWSCEAV